MTNYDYTIATDFPNGIVATDRLEEEIQNSAIVTALDRIDTALGICSVWFKAALSGGDETILDGLVAVHTGEALPNNTPNPVKLYTGNMPIPTTSDGKPVFLPNLFPGNVLLYITGVGDSSTTIGAGTKFQLNSASGTQSVDFQFRDWCFLAGGGIFYQAATTGDEISMKCWAPATTYSAAPGGNTGDCNRVDIGGGTYMLVPAAGNGAYNITSAIPVPSYDAENGELPAGYWDWSTPDTGLGTVTANADTKGGYNLYSFPIDISYFVRSLQLVGNGADGNFQLTVPVIKPKKILPQWKFTVTLTNGGVLHTVKTGWYLVTARRKTT